MGLAAGQARLLTITGRKSDCEFESMRLSHQKIALARELADISNEYQDSLDQTKLVYDYYGTGDTSNPLSYGILMKPSILNDYFPITLTDSMGRVILDDKLAKAAKDAGIPQEGLGTLPSDSVRNEFITQLCGSGVISEYLRDKITALPYNQAAGLGGGATVAVITESGNYEEFCKHLQEIGDTIAITTPNESVSGKAEHKEIRFNFNNVGSGNAVSNNGGTNWAISASSDTYYFSLADFLMGKSTADYYTYNKESKKPDQPLFNAVQSSVEDIIDQVGAILEDTLCIDDYSAKALEYATLMIKNTYVPHDDDGINYSTDAVDYSADDDNYKSYIGWAGENQHSTGLRSSRNWNRVDIGNMLNAYLTFFADFMNGVSATDAYGDQVLNVNKGDKQESRLADKYKNDDKILYTWKADTEVSSDDLGQATFYDALFNQICLKGWAQNDNVNDNDYLQKMLENGMMYISRVKDDGYYYQGNYATDSYIKVIADEKRIAAAEAKYNTEKAKLNAKEQTIDMKMKNLDTEISSLTTEYDTIKNTISKNIEKSFKRYSA